MGKRFYSNPGSEIREVYGSKVLDDGSIDVVVVGEDDFQAYIDSFKSQTDINNIIARYNNGDLSALNVNTPLFGDFTKYPKTYAESLQKMIDGEKFFYSLPPETRAEFDNDFNKFMAASTKDDFVVRCGLVKLSDQDSDQASESEVKE